MREHFTKQDQLASLFYFTVRYFNTVKESYIIQNNVYIDSIFFETELKMHAFSFPHIDPLHVKCCTGVCIQQLYSWNISTINSAWRRQLWALSFSICHLKKISNWKCWEMRPSSKVILGPWVRQIVIILQSDSFLWNANESSCVSNKKHLLLKHKLILKSYGAEAVCFF